MSGSKYSKIELEREEKARQEALNKIAILQAGILSQKEKIKTLLQELPHGVKKSFPNDVKKATRWEKKSLPVVSDDMNSNGLNQIVKSLQKLKEEGQSALHSLIEIKEVRREKKAKELIEKREGLLLDLAGVKQLFNKWRPDREATLKSQLDSSLSMIEQGDFIKVDEVLAQIEAEITKLSREAISLEEQDRQRQHTLTALRECIQEMGWDEEEASHLEDEKNPESAIIYKAKSYAAGDITFRLSLEGIDVDSPISKETCIKDFVTLSEKLKRFGVLTKFERIKTVDEPPELRQRGELDLPDSDTSIEAEREV